MVSSEIDPVSPSTAEPATVPGWFSRVFGPVTPLRLVALLVAVGFLGGAIGWGIGQPKQDPLSSVDVGFMQDMTYHHDQAIELSLIVLGKADIGPDLRSYAQEIVIDQRYEQGLFNATLDRFGHPSAPGNTVMGWMGPALAPADMEGLATEAQVVKLRAAKGGDAEALWIALVTNHHLGGMHMADWAARFGHDTTTRNLAKAMVRNQRGEVVDLNRYRLNHQLPIPAGFSDPLTDQRLRPLSLDQN